MVELTLDRIVNLAGDWTDDSRASDQFRDTSEDEQGRLELWYDETGGRFRASQPVTVSEQATPLASEKAALDIGANNLVACTTTTGEQYLYEGRELFDRFRDTTREIARLQSKLKEGRYSSQRIRRLYRQRTRRRDHAQAALVVT